MEFKDFTTGKNDDGRRLDRVLRIFLKDKSLGEIYKLLRKGLIKVNQQKAKPDSHVNEGDVISIAAFLINSNPDNNNYEPKFENSSETICNLDIVFENQHILIINKPYGISVHGSDNNENGLDKAVLAYYQSKYKNKDAENTSLSFRPGPLHRLDRNTIGLLAFSLSLEGAKWFSEGIKNHTIQKKYYGLAEGKLEKKENWEDKLASADKLENGFYTVMQSADGQPAQTTATPLAYGMLNDKPVTLVEYAIKTGRKHQIRAQSKIHGHPLAGDKAYGGTPIKTKYKDLNHEYYLQAYSLTIPDDNPISLPSEIKTGLSLDFVRLLEYCEIRNPGL